MTPGTWFFMAVLVWIGFNFIWILAIEKYVPQWVGAIIATLLAIAVFKYGPRPREEEEEEE
jgi:hypothetical protein